MLTSTNPFGSCMSMQAGSSSIIQKNYIIDFFIYVIIVSERPSCEMQKMVKGYQMYFGTF